MRLQKTERARAALADRAEGLSARERRVLILSDGRRGPEDIAMLLGIDIEAAVQRLLRDGYLERADGHRDGRDRVANLFRRGPNASVITAQDREAIVGNARSHPQAVVATESTTARAASPTAAAPSPAIAAAPRRSLAASKMYVLDLLQFRRDAEAAALQAGIRSSGDAEALTGAVLEAVDYLCRVSNASYGRRILDRVAEILPETALPALAVRAGLGVGHESAADAR